MATQDPNSPYVNYDPYNPSNPNYVPPANPTPVPVDSTAENMRQAMQQRLRMSRGMIGQNRDRGILDLRRRLARSGALNSGGLALGTANIANNATAQRATGANYAATQNIQGMDSFLGDLRNQEYQKWLQNQQFQNSRRLMDMQESDRKDKEGMSWMSMLGGLL